MRKTRDAGYVGGEMPEPLRLRRQDLLDALIALALATLAVATIVTDALEHPRAALVPLALAMTLPLAWRRRRPLTVLVVVMAAMAALTLVSPHAGGDLSVILVTLVATYSVGANAERRASLIGLAIAVAVTAVGLATAPDPHGAGDFVFVVILFGGAWGLGAALRDRGVRAARLEDHATRLERDRERLAREAVLEERARIARELHDVVAHSVSVMVVQNGVVRRRIAGDRPEDAQLLHEVEELGRGALGEMRRLLGLLRTDDEGLVLAPQPGMESLPALVDRLREAGQPVELAVEGEPRALQPGLDLAAYRIVQEALTNTLKHASGAPTRVLVRFGSRRLELGIEDDGGAGTAARNGHGHGLVGMRERAALYGGELAAGPRAGTGFAVHASLPLEEMR